LKGQVTRIEASGEPSVPHVCVTQGDTPSNGFRFGRQPRLEVVQHRARKVEPGHGVASPRHWQGDASIARAVLEHRPGAALSAGVPVREPDVECDVVGSTLVRRRLVSRLFVMSARARLEFPYLSADLAPRVDLASPMPGERVSGARFSAVSIHSSTTVARPIEVDFAGGDLPKAQHGGFVPRTHERVRALHDLTRPLGREHDERETVLFTLEAIFDGDAGHLRVSFWSRSWVPKTTEPDRSWEPATCARPPKGQQA
jgi:hypothetical protein